MLDKNGIELCAGDLAHVKRGSKWMRVWVRAVRVSPYGKKRPEVLVDNGERWDVEAAGTATFTAWEDDSKKIAKFTRAIPAAPVAVAGETANALRSIATIIGCPANVDPLDDLPGLVDAVKGIDQQAKAREIQIASMREQIADLTAQRDRAIETAVYATKAGRSKIAPYDYAAAVFAAYDAGDGDGDRCATAQSLDVERAGLDQVRAGLLKTVGEAVLAAAEVER